MKRHEGRDGQEDSVERLLRASPDLHASPAATKPCLEADVLAAWAEGVLRSDELRAAEAHASGCARCRAVLAAIVQTEPVVTTGAAALPWWRRGWNPGWLVPLAGAAAALVVWVALPDRARQIAEPIEVGRQAEAPATEPVVELRREANDALVTREAAAAQGADQAAAPPPQGFAARAAAPAARLAAGADVSSPDPSIRWRITPAGAVERTRDGGASWTPQAIPAAVSAGDAPGADVCWLVGPSGAVFLTVDGQTWRQRPFPEPVDLVAVDAADAERATVATADGRRFATADGGATWTSASLQGF